jgi:hypothetical protein
MGLYPPLADCPTNLISFLKALVPLCLRGRISPAFRRKYGHRKSSVSIQTALHPYFISNITSVTNLSQIVK